LPLPDAVRIAPDVLDAIVAHARAAAPRECCGLLIGVDDEVVEAVATANVAGDPTRRYEIPPLEYIAQIRRCRALSASDGRGYAVVGAYHSHPKSAPEPSPTDVAQSFSEFLYVIAGPADGEVVTTQGYRLSGGKLLPVTLVRLKADTTYD
jgi:proteasome lid subunit RPN8/RPN11